MFGFIGGEESSVEVLGFGFRVMMEQVQDDEWEGDGEEYGLQQQLYSSKMRLHDRLKVSTLATAETTAQKHNLEVSSLVMTALAELTFKFTEVLATDTELFARHAGRKSVVMEDVLLAARRNEDVASSLRSMAEQFAKEKEQRPDKRRKKGPAEATT